jgi:hypothetical protein
MAKTDYKIPFNSLTNQMLSYPEPWQHMQEIIVWKDNIEWDDELQYETYSRGRSAINFIFKSNITGTQYLMFVSDFDNVVPFMIQGKLKGRFICHKQGCNYGMKLVNNKIVNENK